MKQEIKRMREERERQEERKIMEAINKQYKKANREYHERIEREYNERLLQEQVNKIKREKEQKKEEITNIILIAVVILTLIGFTIALTTVSNNEPKDYTQHCTAAGFPTSYCERQMQ